MYGKVTGAFTSKLTVFYIMKKFGSNWVKILTFVAINR